MYRDNNYPAASPLVLVTIGNVVEACDRRTGNVIWRYQASEVNEGFQIPLRCVVNGDRAVLLAPGSIDGFFSQTSSPVASCLDYLTGRLHWSVELPINIHVNYTHVAVLVDEGQVMIAGMSAMFCLSLADGTLQWQRTIHDVDHQHLRAGLAIPGHAIQIDSK
jgi:outer membrane protein assembly factor BamB